MEKTKPLNCGVVTIPYKIVYSQIAHIQIVVFNRERCIVFNYAPFWVESFLYEFDYEIAS